jgi:hypothetical protein
VSGTWRIEESDGACLLAAGPARRFDIAAEAAWPASGDPGPAFRRALARQVRQDVWRALRRLPGFRPVVEVRTCGGTVRLRAGGEVAGGRVPGNAATLVREVIECGPNRTRWIAEALRRAGRAVT